MKLLLSVSEKLRGQLIYEPGDRLGRATSQREA